MVGLPKVVWFLAPLLFVAASAGATESACFNSEQSEVSLLSPYSVAPRQTEQTVGVRFKTKPGWHVYWKNSGDAGYPPVIDWSLSPGLQAKEARWPAPRRYVQRGGLEALGYEGEVVYPFTLRFAEAKESLELKADVDYLVCEDECVPYRCMLSLSVPTANEPKLDSQSSEMFSRFEQQVPKTWEKGAQHREWIDEKLVFSVEIHSKEFVSKDYQPALFLAVHPELDSTALPVSVVGDSTILRMQLKPKVKGQLSQPVALEYTVTGLAQPVTQTVQLSVGERPKARPPLSAASIDNNKPEPSAPSLPLLLLLAWLGGLILNVMPCVLPVLSIKLIGLLEKSADTAAAVRRSALGTTLGVLLSFLGLFAISQVARHAGHAVGWGMQFQEPTFVLFLLLLVSLFALNLWGLFEIQLPSFLLQRLAGRESGSFASAVASGLFATLLATPCSAPFLGTAVAVALTSDVATSALMFATIGVGLATPYLLLAWRPTAVRFLPKPGMWMVQLKHGLGYALAATAVWLVFVLSALVPRETVAYQLLCLLGLALGLQIYGPSKTRWLFGASIVFVSLGLPFSLIRSTAGAESGIEWRAFNEAEAQRLSDSGQFVFVDVTADWCFTCKANEHGVLASNEVASLFASKKVVAMRADWTQRSPAIGEFLKKHNRFGIPFYAMYRPKLNPVVLPELLTAAMLREALESPQPTGDKR